MTENKMGVMDVRQLLIQMSLPIMISMLVQALYNIVDSMFVARVSTEALTAVSLCYPVQMILVAVACGTGVGVNALLSRYLGQQDPQMASQTALHGIFLGLMNGLVFALLGFFGARSFLALFTHQANILEMGVVYMRICTVFSFGVFVQITYERIMQATGNTFYNMVIQGVGALVNIILDPIFIFGWLGLPAMGVAGAAIATVAGQIVAMILGIWITQKKVKEITIHVRVFRLSAKLLGNLYRIAIPAILMQSITSFMTVLMNMILVPFGELAVSCFSIYYKLQQFVFMAVSGLTNALIPIVSYNYGARKYHRIREATRYSLLFSCVLMGVGTLIFQLFNRELLLLFEATQEMLAIGSPALSIISWSFILAGISMVLGSVFQAVDHGGQSLMITLFRQMILLLPLVYLLAFTFGLAISWWAFVITEGAMAVLSLYLYRRICRRSLQIPA